MKLTPMRFANASDVDDGEFASVFLKQQRKGVVSDSHDEAKAQA